jgi:L,D-transpeptidase YcbB
MGTRRVAGFLAVAFGLLAGPGAAEEPASEIVLPEPPAVSVVVETVATPDPPPTRQPEPAPKAEIALPGLPDAPVAFTVADKLGVALSARLADPKFQLAPKLAKKDREAIAAFYALGDFRPLWLAGEAWTPAALAVIARLEKAAEDGLDPADYPVPALAADGDQAGGLAEADLRLSAAAVLYARDARGARIDLARLSRLITPKLELPVADAVLTLVASAKDAGAALQSYNPPHAGYRALKAKLADIRRDSARARLEADILANMERWRWVPSDMGRRHIWVNVPEYKLRLVTDGRAIHEARVIVGKPETPTPLFSDVMEHAIVNPSWYVPPSIFKNEFYSDPAYAASRGYQVVRTRDGGISVRQPPGERNALGFIKFMFPNQHAVYLHDTPNRNLFNAQKRAFSHGCVRLDQPFRFGEFVLGPEWSEGRLRSLIGRGERTIKLPEKIPVHLTYFTLVADEKGELHQIADLYAVNNKVRVALGLPSDGTRVLAEAKPRRDPSRAQARRRSAERAQTAVRAPAPYSEPPFWWWTTR